MESDGVQQLKVAAVYKAMTPGYLWLKVDISEKWLLMGAAQELQTSLRLKVMEMINAGQDDDLQ